MKNKKVLLVVFGLLIGVSISFAYFVGRSLTSGSGASLTVKTATLNGTKMKVEGTLEFNDLYIYPGHTEVSGIKVTATGNNELIPYNLIWKGINSLYTSLNYKVYKSDSKIEVEASCEKKKEIQDGKQLLYEVCNISNESELGKEIYTGTIERSEETTKILLAEDEYITSTEEGKEVYYYVVIEYPNTEDIEENQNQDIGKEFSGEVTVEKSETNADLNVIAMYKSDGEKDEVIEEVPEGYYDIDNERSYCIVGNEKEIKITNNMEYTGNSVKIDINKKGTKCYVYFISAAANTLADIGIKEEIKEGKTEFTGIATDADSGLFSGEDDYGTTYYYRGNIDNNWVQFAKKWWRIIRINGDGTIRLIYGGESSSDIGFQNNGKNEKDRVAFNSQAGDNTYVGLTNKGSNSTDYNDAHTGSNPCTILTELNSWYTNNLSSFEDKIDENTGFCNDRTIAPDNQQWWTSENSSRSQRGFGTNTTAYGAFNRFMTTEGSYKFSGTALNPTLKCSNIDRDLYTKKGSTQGNKKLDHSIGLITADEVVFAGGYPGQSNTDYWLYTGDHYWTMSPSYIGQDGSARVFYVYANGRLNPDYVTYTTPGVRPVINLKADTPFEVGNGTSTNPFVVKLD